MPLYSYKCAACGSRRDVFKPLAELDRVEYCEACRSVASRQLSAVAIRADYAGYSCPITGKWIEGRRAHQENLARHGCRVYETGETAQVIAARAAREAAFDASVDRTVDEFITNLPSAKRDKLAAEIDNGLDVAVTRA